MSRALIALALLGLASCAAPQRYAAQAAKLAAFDVTLAANDSATEALEQWCEQERLASPARVTARRIKRSAKPPEDLRSLLEISAQEPVQYRHVILSCGRKPLSVAHNWFVPSRLGPGMEQQLAQTDTPFGKVAAPLAFRREPLETLYDPPPECPADTISAHRALLRLPDGRPLAYVIECYTPANLQGGR
ncbi:MAG: chorismate--pyruvate lyase family protein [Novosphingobium sp.]